MEINEAERNKDMRRLISLLAALAIVLGVSGSASGSYWEVTYDLGLGGSFLTTQTPFGPKVSPITGTFTLQYAGPMTGPISGARLVAGDPYTTFNQVYTGFFTITGHVSTTLLPPVGGTPGTISGADLTLAVVADSNLTGFNHCTDTDSGASCVLAAFVASFNNPLTVTTSPNPWPVPKLQFASAVGSGDFTSTMKTDVGGGVTQQWIFKGKEVSRVFHPDGVPSVSKGGLVGLGLFMLLSATSALVYRRARRP
jgi:hypothetical protein